MIMKMVSVIALGLAVSACAGHTEKARIISDKVAHGAAQAVCAMTIGAHYRQNDEEHRATRNFAKVFCR